MSQYASRHHISYDGFFIVGGSTMHTTFRYERGDLITDLQLRGLPYRVERRLVDKDTEVGLYVIKRVDDNTELLRNAKLIDNPACFARCTGEE